MNNNGHAPSSPTLPNEKVVANPDNLPLVVPSVQSASPVPALQVRETPMVSNSRQARVERDKHQRQQVEIISDTILTVLAQDAAVFVVANAQEQLDIGQDVLMGRLYSGRERHRVAQEWLRDRTADLMNVLGASIMAHTESFSKRIGEHL